MKHSIKSQTVNTGRSWWRRFALPYLILPIAAACLFSSNAAATPFLFESTQVQSGYAGYIAGQEIGTGPTNAKSTIGTEITSLPFDFSDQPFNKIIKLTNWSLTFTMVDGDTAVGDFDYKNIFYYFDGIHAQTWTNYFPNNQQKTFTQYNPLIQFSSLPNFISHAPMIQDALISDGKLMVTLFDATSVSTPNLIELPSTFSATLRFTAEIMPIPEPASYTLLLAGVGVMGAVARRRKKKSNN
jgi:hypothetical protein